MVTEREQANIELVDRVEQTLKLQEKAHTRTHKHVHTSTHRVVYIVFALFRCIVIAGMSL